MGNRFFDKPILNSPYEYPKRHWELDEHGQPTQRIIEERRRAKFITPIPNPQTQQGRGRQASMVIDEGRGLSTQKQQYHEELLFNINGVREQVDRWRELPQSQWQVTAATARLLQHWRGHEFSGIRPFFCQIEAVETAIWLTEVAPNAGKTGKRFLKYLEDANSDANPGLMRLALKLATGAGKTTVMAMLIAWQTINAARHPLSKRFTSGFLILTPGLTIRDRLRVLQPNDPYSYYKSRELVPGDMLPDLNRASIVITNYHAFRQRERISLTAGGRSLLKGRTGRALDTMETEGQMLQRVVSSLMSMKNILVINDEAHHCYSEKSKNVEDPIRDEDEKKEAKKNQETARLWISGLEAVDRMLGVSRVMDLSATPFFLRGSGHPEGIMFPWTMSDFSLMDAIECGIVKLPRVPVADNLTTAGEMPMFRNLWEHIRNKMPKKGRGKGESLDPLSLPTPLVAALDTLYGHYRGTYELWQEADLQMPPCFIVICNNTATSKLVYDYISGFHRERTDGTATFHNGRLPLFRNFDDQGNPIARPRTLLIDSEQIESGDALDKNFRTMAKDEIESFRREIIQRTGDQRQADKITEQDLLREVMNTVGKPGRLGDSIRCVVSVSMLTEGWDANTVTHVLGIRAFGTQLLCEQVVGRALRRQSYTLNEEKLFDVEYADVFGIPFDFAAEPVIVKPQTPPPTIHVKAMRPERDVLEIRFPRVSHYRVDSPRERLTARFDEASTLELTPDLTGATRTKSSGIIGEPVDFRLIQAGDIREATVIFELTSHLLMTEWRDTNGDPELYLFGQLKTIVRQWFNQHLVCRGGTSPAQLKYKMLADLACNKIRAGIDRSQERSQDILALLDPYNPEGSTAEVNFTTSAKILRHETDARRCHLNWAILDSKWEAEFCRIAEAHDQVLSYVKNHNLGFEVPYRFGSETRRYFPDFIVKVDDGGGGDEPLNLIVEIKGVRREDAREKKATMVTYWVPGVNNRGDFGRWAFAEFTDVHGMDAEFGRLVKHFRTRAGFDPKTAGQTGNNAQNAETSYNIDGNTG